jgi:hypothetical protein
MEEPKVMVQDATPKKVMALASRKYSRDDRIKKTKRSWKNFLLNKKAKQLRNKKLKR